MPLEGPLHGLVNSNTRGHPSLDVDMFGQEWSILKVVPNPSVLQDESLPQFKQLVLLSLI
jgi:hypothetical protein